MKAAKENKVRLTQEAHWLLAEMGHDCDASMKELASEAITRMANRTREKKRYAFGTFALGTLTGGCLVCAYFVGMV